MHADLVFTGGPVYTADQARRRLVRAGPGASAVAVAGGRIITVTAAGPQIRDLTGPGTEVVDLRGRALLPGFQDAHVHPVFAGVDMTGCDLTGAASLEECARRISGLRRGPPRPGLDRRRRLVDGVLPRRHARPRAPRRASRRPARVPAQPRPHGAGPTPARWSSPGSTRARLTRADGRIEREPDGAPRAPCTRAPRTLVGRQVPRRRRGPAGRAAAGPGHLHARGVTAWQDAIVGSYRGLGDPLPRLPGRPWPASSPRGWSARCGGTASRGARAAR